MPADSTPFSIYMQPRSPGGKYKSISAFTWENIPPLSIITGRNGSGKTQLLNLISHHLTKTIPNDLNQHEVIPLEITTTGPEYSPDEVGFIGSDGWTPSNSYSSVSEMPNMSRYVLQFAKNIASYRSDPTNTSKAYMVRKLLKNIDISSASDEQLFDLLPDDFRHTIAGVDVVNGMASVFLAYHYKAVEARERNTPGLDIDGNDIGRAPWDFVNEALKAADFSYRITPPHGMYIGKTYQLEFVDQLTNNSVGAIDLSSGEQVILRLLLWTFSSTKEDIFPKILLLDEPDAHLHPSMTSQFLNVITEVFIKKYGVRVIMTTHSPSTVALAPEGSVFQMERGANQLIRVSSHDDIIPVLTSGLITVSRASKFCFVEDNGDVDFYNLIRDLLTDYGPSKDPMCLRTTPSFVFISASAGKGSDKVSGGCTVVRNWVEKFEGSPLRTTFFGVTDKDVNNPESLRVKILTRYSIENYLLDPVNIFSLLLDGGRAPEVEDIAISPGDDHLLRAMNNAQLQAISNTVTSLMGTSFPGEAANQLVEVEYTRGQKIQVPHWVVNHQGHSLLSIAQGAFGQQVVTPPKLLAAMRRVRLIPIELANMLAAIQSL
ncbi:ATP-binding protein [Chelatococcus asaccharovorans]|uniref:AAA15 family ATPase/GTPase n=1 Tax=Chelatococcus asaccharovorans TaxID=28210 RepID=A0A2V3UAG3_9HYPH|nr:ATP-binding protein [Chelatococcus asaccharovorans]MBS7703164.1 ATP-binding protein [Chelatococcus asaccharovorans]PXW61493.1 AAA15 family ATPase/GTPase [Chelatococcus asaccharovorans]